MEKETDVVPGTMALASAKSFNIPQKIHFTKVFKEFYVSQIGLQTLQEWLKSKLFLFLNRG